MRAPLVLIPGMMCDARLFAPQIAAFSRSRPVMAAAPVGADAVPALARLILESAPPRFRLAGLSLGGIVAMEIVARAPERVERLALMDTNPAPDPPEMAERRRAQVARVREGALRELMRDEMKPNYLAGGPGAAAILDLCMNMAEALGPEVFAAQSEAVRTRPDQQEALRRVAVPTLVLCGEADRLCPPDRHRRMAELIPGARLELIPGAGHLPTLEQPEATTEAMERWLET